MNPTPWVSSSLPYLTAAGEGHDAWAEEAKRLSSHGTQRLGEVGEIVPPREVADALGTGPDPVIVRRRVMLLDEAPIELTDSYYPAAIARGTALAEPRKIRGGAVSLLTMLGHPPSRVREDVYAHRPTHPERELLQLGEPDWTMRIFRVTLTAAPLPIEVSVMTMPAESRRLRYELSVE